MKQTDLAALRATAETGKPIGRELAHAVLRADPADTPEILAVASAVRRRNFGDRFNLCSILNARSGACGEDCAFCAQASRHSDAESPIFPMVSRRAMIEAFDEAAGTPVSRFSIVTSGEGLSQAGLEDVCAAIAERRDRNLRWCASLGCLDEEELGALRAAGLGRYHHNLETAESFFHEICTTHSWRERVETVRAARRVGLEVCSGGLLGMGESLEQRVDLAAALRCEAVDSIPLNFLIPIPGTPLEHVEPMRPLEILRTVAMFRLFNPEAGLRVCGGRVHLRDLQVMLFYAGATGMMIGPLLTVDGRDRDDDLRMMRDLEVQLER